MNGEIAKAICRVMAAVPNVEKGGENRFHGYRYAGEADFLRAVQPAMVKAGLAMVPVSIVRDVVPGPKTSRGKEQSVTTVQVTYRLIHSSGEHLDIQAIGSGIDSEEKGTFKAMTGALKYALRQTFLVPTGDDPDHGADESTPSPAPSAPVRQELPAWYVAGLQKMELTPEWVEGMLAWMQDGKPVQLLGMPDDRLRKQLAWLAGEDGTDKIVGYLDHLDQVAKPAVDPSWQTDSASFVEFLAEIDLTLPQVDEWCASKGKPLTRAMSREQRQKLIAYLRDANGAAQVKEWAANNREQP